MSTLGVIAGLQHYMVSLSDMYGWSVSDVVLGLVVVNLAGGEVVEDIDRLNMDVGFSRVTELANSIGYTPATPTIGT